MSNASESPAPLEPNVVTAAPVRPRLQHEPILTAEQWDEAHAMYLADGSPTAIAKVFTNRGIQMIPAQISAKASKMGWPAEREKLRKGALAVATPQVVDKRAEVKAQLENDLQDMMVQGVAVLKRNPPATRKQVREQFAAVREILETAKPILGIGDGPSGGKPPISLQFLITAERHVRPAPPKTLEIQAVPA